MNIIHNLLAKASDTTLRELVLEIQESDQAGYVKKHNSLLTEYASKAKELVQEENYPYMLIVTISALKEFSFREVLKPTLYHANAS